MDAYDIHERWVSRFTMLVQILLGATALFLLHKSCDKKQKHKSNWQSDKLRQKLVLKKKMFISNSKLHFEPLFVID